MPPTPPNPDVPAGGAPHLPHPKTFAPANLALLAVLSIFGAVIGIELLVKLGVTPKYIDHRCAGGNDLRTRAFAVLRQLPLYPRPKSGAKRDFGGDLWCGELLVAAHRHSLFDGTWRFDHADVCGRVAHHAAGWLYAVSDVRQ